MKQKADHHLEFLADKNDRNVNPLLPPLSGVAGRNGFPAPLTASKASQGRISAQHTPLRISHTLPGGEEDAAGESDDATGEFAAESSSRHKTQGPSKASAAGADTARDSTPGTVSPDVPNDATNISLQLLELEAQAAVVEVRVSHLHQATGEPTGLGLMAIEM